MTQSSDEDYYMVPGGADALMYDVIGEPTELLQAYYEPMDFRNDLTSHSTCSATDYGPWAFCTFRSLSYSEFEHYPAICDAESTFDPLECSLSSDSLAADEPSSLFALSGRKIEDSGFESTRADSPPASHEITEPQHRCHFTECPSGPFETAFDFKVHLKQHSEKICDADTAAARPRRCPWPRCCSKALFKTRTQLQTHLDNIHVSPLQCTEAGCTHRTPFRSKYDLKRHVQTMHDGKREPQYACPYVGCRATTRTFARKDKWLMHLRSAHLFAEHPRCPLNHCSVGRDDGIASQHELVKHIMKRHGSSSYECAIGSCGAQRSSRFDDFMLYRHLESCHGMCDRDIATARNAATLESDRTVKMAQLRTPESYIDCTECMSD
ncbi:zinc finger protein zic 4 [Phlyctema vagabunda]|uniref:Zinc finger protein zic 4 n=1 Tax=Phlyctema vagabunda TaxID=108571 RepID=A0ABR4PGI8_9HELO